jgi:outer membrane protein OmpA-like peptidoglycan-associated protein
MNRRLAVPIILLLLLFCAGTVWALLGPLHLGQAPTVEKPLTAQGAQPASPASEAKLESKLDLGLDTKPTEANGAPPGDAAFDVVRIDPHGTSVFAGRTEPGAQVTITGDGKKLGTAQADENGEWTFTVEEKFASNDPKLDLDVKPAAEVKKEAAATPSAGPTSLPQSAPATAADAGAPHTASAVTAHLLKDLQGMVNEARSGSAQEPTVKAQTDQPTALGVQPGPGQSGPAPPQATPQTGQPPRAVPAPQTAAAAPGTVPEPKPTGTRSDGGNVTAAKVAAPAPGETVRRSIPVPITFVFNEAQFTSDGRKAADLLLEYLKLKSFKKIALTGHADERGSDELNMSLSRDRLETVAEFLKQGGFSGDLELVPKGKTEPYTGVVRSEYNLEELYQLDRRVELVVKP